MFLCVCVAQEPGGSPCPSTCPELSKSPTLSSLSESGAVDVCCLLVLAVENKVTNLSSLLFNECGTVVLHISSEARLYNNNLVVS